MRRAFRCFEEMADVVQAEAGPRGSNVPGVDLETGLLALPVATAQRKPEAGVHDLLEGTPGAPRLRLEAAGDVVVEGQRRAHIKMLRERHHDVYPQEIRSRRSVSPPSTVSTCPVM